MTNVWAVFGPNSGKLYTAGTEDQPTAEGRWEPKFSISALDIQAAAVMRQHPAKIQNAAEQIRELYTYYLLTQPQVRLAISRQPAGTAATKLRWTGFKAEVAKILDGTYVEPRFFSFEYRKQLFDQSPACKICGNQIHAFDDCTVDHIHPYARGGKTVPENGQLAHRNCNARKSMTLPESLPPAG
jgi:5-methylcytosine-specific restriction endonuclease McrA